MIYDNSFECVCTKDPYPINAINYCESYSNYNCADTIYFGVIEYDHSYYENMCLNCGIFYIDFCILK